MSRYSSVHEWADTFKKENYPPIQSQSGKMLSLVPHKDIHNQLDQMFPGDKETPSWSYEVIQAGLAAGGQNFVVLKVTVPMEGGFKTVPGAAEGPIGVSGLIPIALRNAVLSGLSMGRSFYEGEEEPAPLPQAGPSNYQQTQTQSNGTSYGGGKNYGPWTGEAKIKPTSKLYEYGQWKNIPDHLIESMANNGIDIAAKERERRGLARGSGAADGAGRTLPPSPFN